MEVADCSLSLRENRRLPDPDPADAGQIPAQILRLG
jgi:hypothetical protein